MSCHITITDNKTGEIYVDTDSCCIIGALFNDSEDAVAEFDFSNAEGGKVFATAEHAKKEGLQQLKRFLKKRLTLLKG